MDYKAFNSMVLMVIVILLYCFLSFIYVIHKYTMIEKYSFQKYIDSKAFCHQNSMFFRNRCFRVFVFSCFSVLSFDVLKTSRTEYPNCENTKLRKHRIAKTP